MELIRSAWAEAPGGEEPTEALPGSEEAPAAPAAANDDDSAVASPADDDDSGETIEAAVEPGQNPFDGKVTNSAKSWAHVSAAYGITLTLLFVYMLVVTVRLARLRRNEES